MSTHPLLTEIRYRDIYYFCDQQLRLCSCIQINFLFTFDSRITWSDHTNAVFAKFRRLCADFAIMTAVFVVTTFVFHQLFGLLHGLNSTVLKPFRIVFLATLFIFANINFQDQCEGNTNWSQLKPPPVATLLIRIVHDCLVFPMLFKMTSNLISLCKHYILHLSHYINRVILSTTEIFGLNVPRIRLFHSKSLVGQFSGVIYNKMTCLTSILNAKTQFHSIKIL